MICDLLNTNIKRPLVTLEISAFSVCEGESELSFIMCILTFFSDAMNFRQPVFNIFISGVFFKHGIVTPQGSVETIELLCVELLKDSRF